MCKTTCLSTSRLQEVQIKDENPLPYTNLTISLKFSKFENSKLSWSSDWSFDWPFHAN